MYILLLSIDIERILLVVRVNCLQNSALINELSFRLVAYRLCRVHIEHQLCLSYKPITSFCGALFLMNFYFLLMLGYLYCHSRKMDCFGRGSRIMWYLWLLYRMPNISSS